MSTVYTDPPRTVVKRERAETVLTCERHGE